MPDFFDVIKTRRTVRSYTDEPVSEQDLRELIDLATLAPTGMNLQPWAFTVITDRQTLDTLNARVLPVLRSSGFFESIQIEGLKQALNDPAHDIFHRAPALVVIAGNKQAPGAMIDCQLAAENLFLAAHAKGLGTCYMGFLMFGRDDLEVCSLLRIPEGYELMAAAVVGHPGVPPAGPPRRNPPRIEWVR